MKVLNNVKSPPYMYCSLTHDLGKPLNDSGEDVGKNALFSPGNPGQCVTTKKKQQQ